MTKAGWSQIDITPPLGIAMGGRGPRFAPGASILDPLFAQATVVEDKSGNKIVFLSLDLILVDGGFGQKIQAAVSNVTNTSPENVVVNFSHTHSGPNTHQLDSECDIAESDKLVAYKQELLVRLQRVARAADHNLQPAQIRWKMGTSDVGINRRLPDSNGEAQMLPNVDGSYNKELWILEIKTADEQAVLFSYGCHPVIIYSYCWDGISAEWPGQARQKIKNSLGKSAHVQFLQGLAGDVRPRSVADLENNKFINPTAPEHVEKSANDMAKAVVDALSTEGELLEPEFSAAEGYAVVPCETNETETLEYWKQRENSEDELTRNKARYWVRRHENGAAPITSSVWAIGMVKLAPEFFLAWISGEPVSGWLEILQNHFADKNLWAIGYTKQSSGYLATDKDLPFNGYEAERSRQGKGKLKPGVDEILTSAFAKLEKQINN